MCLKGIRVAIYTTVTFFGGAATHRDRAKGSWHLRARRTLDTSYVTAVYDTPLVLPSDPMPPAGVLRLRNYLRSTRRVPCFSRKSDTERRCCTAESRRYDAHNNNIYNDDGTRAVGRRIGDSARGRNRIILFFSSARGPVRPHHGDELGTYSCILLGKERKKK